MSAPPPSSRFPDPPRPLAPVPQRPANVAPPAKARAHPWRAALLIILLLALAVAAFQGVRRMERFSAEDVQKRLARASLSIEFASRPTHLLDGEIIQSLLKETEIFAHETVPAKNAGVQPITNYARLLDPLVEKDVAPRPGVSPSQLETPYVLRELKEHYREHTADRNNAWIDSIDDIRRVYDPKNNVQHIVISAQFRHPAAFVLQGTSYYLVDPHGIRLPGEYSEADHKVMSSYLVISNLGESVPPPGEAIHTPEAQTALRLVKLLATQPYASQIAAINMANYDGHLNPMEPHIVLDTIFHTQVLWGRLPEKDDYYEITPPAKLKALALLFTRYNRIDANQPYVDIHLDEVRIPAATQR